MEGTALIEMLRAQMEDQSDLTYGEKMAAYMKHHFVFHGIPSPKRTAIQKEWFAAVKESTVDRWELIDTLWDMEQREFQYVAVDFLKRTPKKSITIEDIAAIEHLITTKSWWDTADLIASNYLGSYFEKFPEQIDPIIGKWRHDDNMWLNRSCLIFQLKYKDKADFELLKSLIIQYQGNSEFFIQKAIGWSLRQHSKFDPESVRDFVHDINLEGLAKREAVKYL